MANMPHIIRRNQNTKYCPRCSLTWPHDQVDPPGPCIDTRGDDRLRRQDEWNRRKEGRV